MPFVVARCTQRYKVRRFESELRVRVVVLDVMHCRGLRESAVSLAVYAEVTVTPQHSLAHRLPPCSLAELQLCHSFHLLLAKSATAESTAADCFDLFQEAHFFSVKVCDGRMPAA